MSLSQWIDATNEANTLEEDLIASRPTLSQAGREFRISWSPASALPRLWRVSSLANKQGWCRKVPSSQASGNSQPRAQTQRAVRNTGTFIITLCPLHSGGGERLGSPSGRTLLNGKQASGAASVTPTHENPFHQPPLNVMHLSSS